MTNYPEYAQIEDRRYKINTNYKVALKCQEVSQNDISEEERALAIIYLLFGDEGLKNSQDWNELLQIGLKFLNCGRTIIEKDNDEEPNIDYKQDWSYIRASFFYDYDIDLEEKELHWWKFFELLTGLSEKCILNRIRFIRDFDISQIKDNKERQRWIKQKEQVALKKEIIKSDEEKRLDELFEQQLKGRCGN